MKRLLWESFYFVIVNTMNDIPCTYRISVKAVIKDAAGNILLLREKDGSWELPGGGLEHGEDPKEALTREIAEETGLNVEWMSEEPVAFWSINKDVGSPTLKWFAFVVYEAKVFGEFRPDPTSDESQEAKYFSKKETKQLQLHDNVKPYFV
jgi:8-oxo-dGTP diphosphatase